MKKVFLLIIAVIFALLSFPAHAISINDVSAESCVLMYEDGRCIFEKNADEKRLIASTTKIMTAIVCIENAKLDDIVKIKPGHCAVEGSSMYLKSGEKYSIRELLLGLMLASGNDAALSLADYVAGSIKEFAVLMNEKAKSIGMYNSSFTNPHGLDERGHYSTARDMATLMLYCMKNPTFCELVSTYTASIRDLSFVNHNKLLKQYPWCVGGKTGFTAAAGRCLVSCAEKNGVRLVCVTLSAADDWSDHQRLYEYAYENFYLKDLTTDAVFEIPVNSGSQKSVKVIPAEEVDLLVNKKDKIRLEAEIPVFIFAPVKMGETAGKICVIINDKVIAELPMVYAENVMMAYPCLKPLELEVLY